MKPVTKPKGAAKKKKKKKKNHGLTIILAVFLIAGLSLLLYPSFSNWWNSFHQTHEVAVYQDTVANMTDEETEAILQAAEEYNQSLVNDGGRWLPSDEDLAEYYSLLDPTGNGIMGYVEIPSLDVELPIYHGTSEEVLQKAVGHLTGSSLPIGGENTHAVLSGHRGLPTATLFTHLDKLVEGDKFTVTVMGETMTYMVDQIHTVLPDEMEDLQIEEGKDYVTLVTCTPYGINSHRLLVRGVRVDNDPTILDIDADAVQISPYRVAIAIGVVLVIILFILQGITNRHNRIYEGGDLDA